MENQYMNFWQNAFTDALDKSSPLLQMDKLFEVNMSRFREMSSVFQKLGRWDLLFNPLSPSTFDFKKNMDDYLKMIGLISVDEYQSLVNKYDELKNEKQALEKSQDQQNKKVTEANQSSSNEKKKTAARDKSIEELKVQLDEQKNLAGNLNKDLATEKKQTLAMGKELSELKKTIDSLKSALNEKEKTLKKIEPTKA